MLSKSRIMRGLQCHKSLWLYKHQPELLHISPKQEAIFKRGSDVGVLAQQLFPGGIDATEGHAYPNAQCAERTEELIAAGQSVIYEATFIHNQVLVAIDILVKKDDGWHIYEVKSTNSAKDTHLQDAAIQQYVAEGCGLRIGSVSIVHFNRKYIRQGALDIQRLFKATDITEHTIALKTHLPSTIKELLEVQALERAPAIDIGPHCSSPYDCSFKEHCWKHIPENSVFQLQRGGKKIWKLYHKGIYKLEDIPHAFPLSKMQAMQVNAEKTGKPTVRKEKLAAFLKGLTYPLYYVDFESIQPGVPLYTQSRPYQQIPFQYSLHVQGAPNEACRHRAFLAQPTQGDPRREFIKRLLEDCGQEGTILVYSQAFEKGRINELARDFPEYKAPLLALIDRIEDLIIPFKKGYCYTREMQGSASIKCVLPAFVPELSYKELEISDGEKASSVFLSMVENEFSGDEEKTRNDLLEYCKLDTLAMVKIVEKLYRLIEA